MNTKTVTKIDYLKPISEGVFAYDETSPSCLVFNTIVYGGEKS